MPSVPAISNAVCAFVVVTLLGCATPIAPELPRRSPEQRQYVKNYVIGEKKTVTVGEPMVKFQDYYYWIETIEAAAAVPDRTVTLKGGPIDVTLVAGTKYPVKGRMVVDGNEHTLVALTSDTSQYNAVLIRPDGSLLNRIAAYSTQVGGVILVFWELSISDASARLVRESQKNVNSTRGYQNFELLYTGTNANALTLAYREFSPEGLARVAFFQNLTYEAGARMITFKNYRIAIESASAEAITFTVLADGT